MQENVLNVLEKRALEKGLASQNVRLKAGRSIWDELDASLPRASGDKARDIDRLFAFVQKVKSRPYYEESALKEWLAAQIDSDFPDVIDGDSEHSSMVRIYKEHLELFTTLSE